MFTIVATSAICLETYESFSKTLDSNERREHLHYLVRSYCRYRKLAPSVWKLILDQEGQNGVAGLLEADAARLSRAAERQLNLGCVSKAPLAC